MSTVEEEVKVSQTTSESNELNEDTSNSIVDNRNDKSNQNHIHLHNQQNSNSHTNGTEDESSDHKEAGKLSSLTDELRMPVAMPVSMPVQMPVSLPVATSNVTMSGDLPPLPLMSQMNMSSPRAHTCGPQPQTQSQSQPQAVHATHATLNMTSPHMLHPNTHPNAHNMYHLGPNNNNNNNNNNLTAHNKASLTMDSQYMQQQSQIFVFNTQMANQAADAVDNGLYPSIIDFHCSNPRTKEFLKNHPSKVQAFNRMTTWNNMPHMKQMGRGIKANMINATVMHHSMLNNPFGQQPHPPPQPPPQSQQPRPGLPVSGCAGACNHNVHNSPQGLPQGPGPGGGAPWNANQNMCSNWSPQQHQQQPQHQQLFAQNSNISVTSIGSEARGCNTSSNSLIPCNNSFAANNNNNINFQSNPQLFPNSSICNSGQLMPSQLAGPEIPDENLTPQQRQHREKKLSILRIMQQQLCPEMMEPSSMGQLNNMMRMPLPHQNMESCIHNVLDPMMCTNNMCQLSENEQHVHNNDNAMNSLLTPSTVVSNNSNTNSLQYSQSSQTSMPPTPASAQIEWQKLQTNYLEERRRKLPTTGGGGQVQSSNMCSATNTVPISHHSQSPLSQSSSTMNSPSPCISASPGSRIPPPPYNQGIRPLSSPHPSSPATGSLPMPSPRMQSPADASRQQFATSAQNRVPHASPGPATPSADSNSSLLGSAVHSPKSLPSSTQSSLPSATSSSIVPNSCVVQRTTSTSVTSINNVTTTSIAPISSPSSGKKLNLVSQSAPKALSQECSDMIANNSSNKLHQSSDISLIGAPNCSSPFICKPEPALMPVPSPQQIQYLNAFEGQELTIQKQPNTSLRETDLISPPPGIDLGFSNEFGANSCQPFQGVERMPNFNMNDNMNRFSLNHQAMSMSGHQFDLHPRFILSDGNNQRFVGPNFDGPSRMPNSHDPHFRSQNMVCMPFGNQMENNVMRFPNSSDLIGSGQRIRGPQPMDMAMNVRFNAHLNENIQSPLHFNATMSPLSNEQMNMMSFANSNQSQAPSCMAPVNNFNSPLETGISSTHLQNLQKMTPPFDIGPANKVDGMMQMPNGSMAHSHNNNSQTMHNSNGPLGSQSQRSTNFDPISSMAAMGESNSGSQINSQQNLMNMTNMQVGSNGPPPSNLVNFHTSMSSMQGIHQNMSPDANGMNGGMQNHYNMSQQMAHNMTGGPQTVNNTYVNANLSIQQLNIQNAPNFNPNMNQPLNNQNNMNITPPIGGGVTGLSPPSGAMQMMQQNSSSKLGSGFAHRMPGPTPSGTFTGQQMNNPRGMSPLNYPPNPHMMTRCEYNSANIQVKPNAPNTIQYLPARPQTQNHSNSANIRPSFDFLQRFEPPLTNLGNKLPTHNLQYFPSNNGNMNNSQPPPGMSLPPRLVSQNIPLASGPGRPINTQLVRAPNSNSNINSGQQNLIGSGDMFIRVGGPNNIMNGPHIGGPAAPNNMFTNMKTGNNVNSEPICGSPVPPVHVMAHDASQPLPPSVGHSYNYKQTPFTGIGPMTSDPNYAVQFHNFQQQLYATNTRTSNNTANSNSGSNNSRIPSNNFYNSAK